MPVVSETETVSRWEGRSNAARKAIRTTLQAIVALVPPVLMLLVGVLSPEQALGLGVALTPVVTFAQNLLEDKGVLGTWLRRPTPIDAVATVIVEK